jgi:hypothetical protein
MAAIHQISQSLALHLNFGPAVSEICLSAGRSFHLSRLEELLDRSEHLFLSSRNASAFRQRIEKNLAIGFFQNSTIKNHDRPTVGFTANQAPEALFVFDDCLWD